MPTITGHKISTDRVQISNIDNIGYVKRGEVMSKNVTFGEKDSELIKKIEIYQKEQRLPSFVEAVRILCGKGLQVNELFK